MTLSLNSSRYVSSASPPYTENSVSRYLNFTPSNLRLLISSLLLHTLYDYIDCIMYQKKEEIEEILEFVRSEYCYEMCFFIDFDYNAYRDKFIKE